MTLYLCADDVIIIILSHLPPFPSDVVVDTLTTHSVCTTPTTRVVPSSLSLPSSSLLVAVVVVRHRLGHVDGVLRTRFCRGRGRRRRSLVGRHTKTTTLIPAG